jgi:hypothetical protein
LELDGEIWLLFQFANFVLFANNPKKSYVTGNYKKCWLLCKCRKGSLFSSCSRNVLQLWDLEELLNTPQENNHEEKEAVQADSDDNDNDDEIYIDDIVHPKSSDKLINFL